MPVRVLAVPGGLCAANVPLVRGQQLWQSLWPGQSNAPPYIAICHTGRNSRVGELHNLPETLEKLFPQAVSHIMDITDTDVEQHLVKCDVFYMSGGNAQRFADMFKTHRSTMDMLKSRICSGQILYIGSGAGACILGSTYHGESTMDLIHGRVSVSDNEEQIGDKDQTRDSILPVTMTKQTGLMLHGDESLGFVIRVSGPQTLKHLAEKLDSQVRKCSSLRNAVRYDKKGVPMDFESERIRSTWEVPPPPGLGPPQGLLPPQPPPGLPPPCQWNVSIPSHHINFMPPPSPPPPGPSNVSLPSIPEPPSPRLPPQANVIFPSRLKQLAAAKAAQSSRKQPSIAQTNPEQPKAAQSRPEQPKTVESYLDSLPMMPKSFQAFLAAAQGWHDIKAGRHYPQSNNQRLDSAPPVLLPATETTPASSNANAQLNIEMAARNKAPATADQPSTSMAASPEYYRNDIRFGAKDEHSIKMFVPRRRESDRSIQHVVLYLASADKVEPSVSDFTGSEIVYVPEFASYGPGRQHFKNEVPGWLIDWIMQKQAEDTSRWSLVGFSRGAAWGAIVAVDARLTFHRVLLVGPYILPQSKREQGFIERLVTTLPKYNHKLCIVFGSADPWQPCDLVRRIQDTSGCLSYLYPGLGQKESFSAASRRLWRRLFV